MPSFDRLIDHIPDSPESVRVWTIIAGAIGMMTAFLIQDLPLSVGSFLLYLGGKFGPGFYDLKQKRKARRSVIPVEDDPLEDARVDAFVMAMKHKAASLRLQESTAVEIQPSRHLLH